MAKCGGGYISVFGNIGHVLIFNHIDKCYFYVIIYPCGYNTN